ncbi:glycosyltransferase [Paenibacillus azoreducens]|uniref:4,4'-diaponeurosporenoate glycosyltransferase n=1 Tax=Paenibacillus azoreducens TaxID=116718 RepID=A0A919YEQ8_9BACL|nr:glycosyltransferase family 2 protein [Paenibacillus azoreducens]GIO49369.1 glycosyl hydrolase [Paenibacillus azoreducens]
MQILWYILGSINVIMWGFGLLLVQQIKKITILRKYDPPALTEPPLVSVIVAARNEQKAIERCVDSLMAQSYGKLEVIVVNDRSTDDTGNCLARLQLRHPSLRIITIGHLPEGWLGKNHALYQGTLAAKGEWILYTDADILFAPQTLEKSIAYSIEHQLDHLTLIPAFTGSHLVSKWYSTFIFLSASAFGMLWKTKDPKAKNSLGVGAFNLLKRSVYEQIGTHQAFAMHTTDDAKLGELVKRHGFKQEVVYGRDLVEVWNYYESTTQLIRSVEKNVFTFPNAIGVTISCTLTMIYPFFGLFIGHTGPRILCAIAVLCILLMYAIYSTYAKSRFWYGLFHPYVAFLLILGALRGASVSSRGGMTWRGTVYSREKLNQK